jgi:GIY-YIG catalytic domain
VAPPGGGTYWLGACSFAAIDGNLMAMSAPGAIAGLPVASGVYRFRDARGGVLYVGRATALRNRVASYWSDLRERGHLAPMVARVTRIEAVTCDSPHEAALLERNLLEASLPPWNRTPGGQETWSTSGWTRSHEHRDSPSTTSGGPPPMCSRGFAQRNAELAAALVERF